MTLVTPGSKMALTACVGAAATAVALRMMKTKFRGTTQKDTDDDDGKDMASIELSEFDRFLTIFLPITSLTWFRGDYKKAKLTLEHRMNAILEKNPWLQGELTKTSKGFHLCYPNPSSKTHIKVEDHLVIVDEDISPISRDTPVEKLGELLSAFNMQNKDLFLENGTHKCVFRAFIFPCRENSNSSFALVFQLNHAVGDGATYYNLLHMLCSIEEECIIQLNPIRDTSYQEQAIARLGKKEAAFEAGTTKILFFIWGCLKTLPFYDPSSTHRYQYAYVDPSKMKEAKAAAMRKQEQGSHANDIVPFVSTNDIITSWFMRETQCDYGDLAINMRGRLEGITDASAGNYQRTILYYKKDIETPMLIRKSVQNFKRVITGEEGIPGAFTYVRSRVALVSNWSSLAKPAFIKDCQEEFHVPLHISTSYWSSLFPSTFSILLIFRAGPGKIGMSVYHPNNINLASEAPFAI
jgi:hypothetical protein